MVGIPNLLVIDDDNELCVALEEILRRQGFSVQLEQDGLVGLHRALHDSFDLLVLDVALPGLDGFSALTQLRKESQMPVLMLTACGGKGDRIRGLESGADDYLTKPFEPEELLARIRAILRRSSAPRPKEAAEPLKVGELTLYPGAGEAYLGKVDLRLTAVEGEIVEQLMRAAGRPVSRDQISLFLYGRPVAPFERWIDTHINRVRRKFGEKADMIVSVRGIGYQLLLPANYEPS